MKLPFSLAYIRSDTENSGLIAERIRIFTMQVEQHDTSGLEAIRVRNGPQDVGYRI